MIKVVFPIFLVICWQVTASILNVHYFPTIEQIFAAFVKTWTTSNEIEMDVIASLSRLAIGLSISIPFSIALGTLIGLNKKIKDLLIGSINCLRAMPITALTPLITMICGITEAASIFIVFLVSAVPTLVVTIDSVEQTIEKYRPLIRNFELSWPSAIAKVILPGSMPAILSGIDISINSAFKMLILAELLGSASGLGYRLIDSSHYLDFDKTYYLLLVIGFLGLMIATLTSFTRKKILSWT